LQYGRELPDKYPGSQISSPCTMLKRGFKKNLCPYQFSSIIIKKINCKINMPDSSLPEKRFIRGSF